MDWLTNWLLEFVSHSDNPAGLAVLGLSAMVEYLFPPFPGDTITLFGAVLITAYGWSFAAVFGVVMAGSMTGAMADYYLGNWLRLRRERRELESSAGSRRRRRILDDLIAKFDRHGALYLVLNRFVPGVRAFFFVAAGMAGMKPLAVLLYGTVSALIWNLAVIALGGLLGANLETLAEMVKTYNLVFILVVATVAAVLVGRWYWRRRRKRRVPGEQPDEGKK